MVLPVSARAQADAELAARVQAILSQLPSGKVARNFSYGSQLICLKTTSGGNWSLKTSIGVSRVPLISKRYWFAIVFLGWLMPQAIKLGGPMQEAIKRTAAITAAHRLFLGSAQK